MGGLSKIAFETPQTPQLTPRLTSILASSVGQVTNRPRRVGVKGKKYGINSITIPKP